MSSNQKKCPRCGKLNHLSATSCWTCYYSFPPSEDKDEKRNLFVTVLFAIIFMFIAVTIGIPIILKLLCMSMGGFK